MNVRPPARMLKYDFAQSSTEDLKDHRPHCETPTARIVRHSAVTFGSVGILEYSVNQIWLRTAGDDILDIAFWAMIL